MGVRCRNHHPFDWNTAAGGGLRFGLVEQSLRHHAGIDNNQRDPDRRAAFDNLAKRCGHNGVKSVATALNQAEKYGTPLGQALRVAANENREMRMQEAERKAASLPAKLTVPMIIFFLPCLFAVIMGPAIMSIKAALH